MDLEEQTAALLSAGDVKGAATAVLRRHGAAVHRFLASALGDWAMADDAHSLFCEWVWRGIGSYQGRSSLRAWSFGVAANAARRVREEPWRQRARRLSTTSAAALLASETRSSGVEAKERERELDEVRAKLTEADRTLLALRLDQALSWREIEAVLAGVGEPASSAALRKRYERIREKLRDLLATRGFLA